MDEEQLGPSFAERMQAQFGRKWQHFMDQSTVYLKSRWVFFFFIFSVYCYRVYYLHGWYIVSYGLGIYILNLTIGFLSPQIDPETEGPVLPTSNSEEFRPFSRRVPEFKFWYGASKAIIIAYGMTFFHVFDVPVFWPILLLYFIMLVFMSMKKQIMHMMKHRYVPWSWGKQKYKGREALDTPGTKKSAD